jgi:hypothetical protein
MRKEELQIYGPFGPVPAAQMLHFEFFPWECSKILFIHSSHYVFVTFCKFFNVLVSSLY